ncbi:U5 small nuclear ribonucleoprotein TSSC4-like [Scyliorhinus torazame]|uniref:U5 small nuclear ribonucleoprotein TSSC4-like n=1 Tax=Scyliorhinus torazame TaxID=75743 RepID=UPI003B5B8C35
MADGETNMVSTDVLLLKDPDLETRLSSDTVSLGDTDSETNLQSFNSLSPLSESDPDSWSPDDSLTDGVEPQCDYMSNHSLSTVGNSPPTQLFQLRGTSSGFSFRSQNIFSGLENVVKFDAPQSRDDILIDGEFKLPPNPAPHRKVAGESPPGKQGSSSKRQVTGERPRGKQSSILYKKTPSVPDYLLHPERWTKYTLEDVPETSSKKNTAVALEFMDNLKKQRKEKPTMDLDESFTSSFTQESDSVSGKILFSKPLKPASSRTGGVDRTEQEGYGVVRKLAKRESLNPEDPGQVDLAHLDYGEIKEVEDVRVWGLEKDTEEPAKDGKRGTTGEKVHELAVFHSGRKRNRMNIRVKPGKDSEDD